MSFFSPKKKKKKKKDASWGGATGFFAPTQFYPSLNGGQTLTVLPKQQSADCLLLCLAETEHPLQTISKVTDTPSITEGGVGGGGGPVTIQGPFKSCTGCLVSSSQIHQEVFFFPSNSPRPPSCISLRAEMLIVKADPRACDKVLAWVWIRPLPAPPIATGINANIITEASLLCLPPTFDLRQGCVLVSVCVCVSFCVQGKITHYQCDNHWDFLKRIRLDPEGGRADSTQRAAKAHAHTRNYIKTITTQLSIESNVMQLFAPGQILWSLRLRRNSHK